MPASAHSFSHLSTGSQNSRKAKSCRYYVVNKKSHVDESLFGEPNRVAQRGALLKEKFQQDDCKTTVNRLLNGQQLDCKDTTAFAPKKKEIVKVVTKDLIRNLVVASEDPSGRSIILDRNEFMRIRQAAQVLTKEQKLAFDERIKEMQDAEKEESLRRRDEMKEMDRGRQQQEGLTDLEQEAAERGQHLLQRANMQRVEQEDEIKALNELILNAKIQAIRDAQLLEKKEISREMVDEEKRLDQMMEIERRNAIKIQEEIEKLRKEEKLIGAAKIIEQMQDNEQERLLELEKKDQENKAMQAYLQKLMQEDVERIEEKHGKQATMRTDLKKANAEILIRKEMAKEQEKVADMRVVQFQQAKAAREAEFEEEQERIRNDKEREVAALRAQQERARDEQSERDAVRARREQERLEREWRRKEATEEEKKAYTEAELKLARRQQLSEKEHYLAMQAERDRGDFERVLRAQKQLIEKERTEEVVTKSKRSNHAKQVRDQICQKEQEQIEKRTAFFEEGAKLDEEARLRRARLEAVKQRKLVELREAGVHEKYLAQVERKVNSHAPIKA